MPTPKLYIYLPGQKLPRPLREHAKHLCELLQEIASGPDKRRGKQMPLFKCVKCGKAGAAVGGSKQGRLCANCKGKEPRVDKAAPAEAGEKTTDE